jgi:hypothetical protein
VFPIVSRMLAKRVIGQGLGLGIREMYHAPMQCIAGKDETHLGFFSSSIGMRSRYGPGTRMEANES